MHTARMSRLLHAGAILAIGVGIGLLFRTGPILTEIRVVLVILGLIGLIEALRYRLTASQPSSNS